MKKFAIFVAATLLLAGCDYGLSGLRDAAIKANGAPGIGIGNTPNQLIQGQKPAQ